MTWSQQIRILWLAAGVVVFFSCNSGRLAAQPASANDSQVASTEVIQEGIELEQNRRWSDAILHYEKASRKFPEDPDLRRRLLISRIHFDVNRRYRDSSFRECVSRLTVEQALELYADVLLKLESNYVDPINLSEILRNGTAFLEVALTEPSFLKQHLSTSDQDKIESFRRNIHRSVLGRSVRNRYEAKQLAQHVSELATRELGLSQTATVYEYICGAVGLLDPYSSFLTPGELREMMSQIEGNFVGLGVELRPLDDRLEVVSVIRGGPAERVGIQGGDLILQVNDSVTAQIGADRAADLLRGPENSQVRLLIQPLSGNPKNLEVYRKRVDVPSVEAPHMIDRVNGIAYLRISNFQKTTDLEIDRALWTLERQGMKSLIVDLRGNPGGLLDASVRVADRFLAEGPIVTTRGRNGTENQNFTAQRSGTWQVPLFVLIDGDSASASEILAGALRDHRRAQLIGETTYGKGSVQGLFNTDVTESGLRLTVSKFFSPSGAPISLRGVKPDIAIHSHSDPQGVDGIQFTSRKDQASTDRQSRTVMVAKPIVGNDGVEVLEPESSERDRALQIALEQARQANRTAAR